MQTSRWVSLGGWCGPGLMLSKLALRHPSDHLPFDMVRTSFDGVIQFAMHGFRQDFFPGKAKPGKSDELVYLPDPASVWLLFRGTHTCFTHFDINREEVQQSFQHRFQQWNDIMDGRGSKGEETVIFFRTSISENPYAEAALLPMWEETIEKRTKGKLKFRTVLAVHDQGPMTEVVAQPTERSVVWNLALDPSLPSCSSLLDKTSTGYEKILRSSMSREFWQKETIYSRTTTVPTEATNLYLSLCTVEGVPALKGSCKGIGSTASSVLGRCVFCGSADGHAVDAKKFDTGKPWSEEEVNALAVSIGSHQDIVAACEEIAVAQQRSANEVWTQLRAMGVDFHIPQ